MLSNRELYVGTLNFFVYYHFNDLRFIYLEIAVVKSSGCSVDCMQDEPAFCNVRSGTEKQPGCLISINILRVPIKTNYFEI